MSTLELLSARPAVPSACPPLLFVHGAYTGAWCWSEYFLPWFSAQGFEAHAVSLRGHGSSSGHEHLDSLGLDDFTGDVIEAAGRLDRPPILVGHSMGGVIVQRAARRCNARGLVLMAPVPPHGLSTSMLSLSLRDPPLLLALNATQIGAGSGSTRQVRDYLFSASLTEADVARHLQRSQRESNRALAELMWPQHWWLAPSVGLPILVIGAGADALLPQGGVYETAAFHGVAPLMMNGMAHALMLEPEWREPAGRIAEWLRARDWA